MTILTVPHAQRTAQSVGRGVDVTLTNVRLVLDDRVVDDATIVVRRHRRSSRLGCSCPARCNRRARVVLPRGPG